MALAQYYVTVKRFPDARRLLQDLATRNDAYAAASVHLAALDAAEGSRAQAETRLSEVLLKYPKDSSAHLLMASLLYLDGKTDEAVNAVNAAIASAPSWPRPHYLAGQLYAGSDRMEDAIKEYEQVLKLDPHPFDAALALARLHLKAGATDKSLTYTQQAIAMRPQSPEAQSLLLQNSLARGELSKAKDQRMHRPCSV
jgi:tetratricopeptide (TPR) repeat protein